MSKQSINSYYNKLARYKRYGGTRNEQSIRRAFANLLEEYCLPKNLLLVDEVSMKTNHKRPDGTVKDALQLDWGYWESKDSKDDLETEISNKFEIGYPKSNIIFENSIDIVLFQEGREVLRGKMEDHELLDRILTAFVEYKRPEIQEFHTAVERFKEDIPDIVEALRAMIAKEAESNKDFQAQRSKFWEVCKESINPEISAFDIREMLIQHILTAEIFDTVFGDSHFHRENNIALQLEKVVNTFFVGAVRRNTLSSVDSYYKTIKRQAANIDNIHEKQKFLKVVYENFYKAYNPKGADKLGVVYTPNEIVKFMVESTDYLLEKHFNKTLSDKNVQILDPATGTGTFITDIIEHIPPQYLEHKYKNEIHCNELAILPYYIANLNIEYTYRQKMQEYVPFENIVFVDTLDNLGFTYEGKQFSMFSMSAENLERIKKQNSNDISVIIGNPPYNANQHSENENNKNREYYLDRNAKRGGVDGRIRDTYVRYSSAQKSKVYDMYSRFYRWASDRISEDGIIAFITNRSFIDSRTFDGFRKSMAEEFDYIYIVDLNGDVRSRSSQAKGNVFGIMTGVAIAFFIKKSAPEKDVKEKKKARILYTSIFKEGQAKEKLEYLQSHKFQLIPFESVVPNENNDWVDLIIDKDFEKHIPLTDKKEREQVLFSLSTNGVATNRDEWVMDFEDKVLSRKVKYFIEKYNHDVEKNKSKKEIGELGESIDYSIKWSRDLKNKLIRRIKLKYSKQLVKSIQYRPFTKKSYYSDFVLNDVLTNNHFKLVGENFHKQNKIIWIKRGINSYFSALAVPMLADIMPHGGSILLGLYKYDENGKRTDNITDWGLKQFREHYEKLEPEPVEGAGSTSSPTTPSGEITKEEIFHYTYGVLHNPTYRKKYELNLKREFPRIPFYDDFRKWADWGKELMDLHIGYEEVEPWDLHRLESDTPKENPKAKLKAKPENGEIILDENTSLLGIPEEAWEYKLGNRSAIGWILDQYKEKKPRDKTIAEKFNTYKFADYKEKVIDLIMRVTRVSVRTVEIMRAMKDNDSDSSAV